MDADALPADVLKRDARIARREKTPRPAVQVPADLLADLLREWRDDPRLSFDMLCDHTAIDWPAENRFELVYQLYSTRHGHALMVSAFVPRDRPEAPSVSAIWGIAEWQEREVYDMFGVLYRGHPDLRRILLDDDWAGFPLRKDYRDDFILERPE